MRALLLAVALVVLQMHAVLSFDGAAENSGVSSQGSKAGTRTLCACCGDRRDFSAVPSASTARPGNVPQLRGGAGDSLPGIERKGGRIELILGPMFAGKSTELMRRIRRQQLALRKCVVIKYAKDNRHGEAYQELATHDNNRIPALPTMKLFDVLEQVGQCDVVGIDEGQFFSDLVPFAEELASCGKIVICAALDGTYLRDVFGPVGQLIPRAESVQKLSAVCKLCGAEAAFTRRTTADTELEAIGGEEMYMPVCRSCISAPIN